jgi:hypothetical protein
MVVAWIGTIVLCALFILMMQHGGGSECETYLLGASSCVPLCQ